MRNIEGIRVHSSTTGSPAPSGFEHLRRNYVYRGDKFDPPGVIETAKGGAKARAAARQERVAEYCRLRDAGVSRADAARRVGVERKTAARYETAWKTGRAES